MDSYKIEFKHSAEHDLRKIPPANIQNILNKIETLSYNPFPLGSIKLSGVEVTYRLRVGNYRVIYEVDKEAKAITICYVRHRKEAYRNL